MDGNAIAQRRAWPLLLLNLRIIGMIYATLINVYGSMMRKYPLATQCATSGCLAALGDAISQLVILRKDHFDRKECFRYFCVGSLYIAPVLRTWYMGLDKIVPLGSKFFAVKKVLLDQAVFAPPFLASILGLLRILDGNQPSEVYNSVARDYKNVLLANWQVWPFIQLANFYFVPLNYQVILVNSASVAWNSYIAYVAEKKDEDVGKEDTA